MNPSQTLSRLRFLAGCYDAAARRNHDMADTLADQHATLVDAIDCIEQLQERLVRQACYFERIEAQQEPKSWPLLEDDDPGMAL